jgi:hypothetical protein
LTEIHLCHACSCQEILRIETARQAELAAMEPTSAAPGASEAAREIEVAAAGAGPQLDTWQLLHISVVREYLAREFVGFLGASVWQPF